MENQNSVCYVARIGEIVPIPGADNIEVVLAGAWQAITKKGQYAVNRLVIVATTDAVIPQKLSDAMNVTNYLRKGQRVRTVKLKGVYSECLIIPIDFIPETYRYEGTDCMELMEIFKYEPPIRQIQLSSGRKIRYSENPNFPTYYKFPNFKNVPNMFTKTDHVEITRKLHGTNARYGIVKKTKLSLWDKVKKLFGDKWIEYEFVVGSHNVEKGSDSQGFYDTNVWYDIADKYEIKNRLWFFVKQCDSITIGNGVTLYGEIYGAGIQKGYDYGYPQGDIRFAAFDVYVDNRYMDSSTSHYITTKVLTLPYVPILYTGFWSQDEQDKWVFNNNIEETKIPHEGIVIKHASGERSKVAKVINPDYLIYAEKHNVEDSH